MVWENCPASSLSASTGSFHWHKWITTTADGRPHSVALSAQKDCSRFASLKGQFILSLNDTPEVRSIFPRFEVVPVEVVHTAGGRKPLREREKLIIEGGGAPSMPF